MGIISNINLEGDNKAMTQLNEKEMQLVEMICEGCSTPADVTSKLKELFAGTIQKMLEAEMDVCPSLKNGQKM